MRQKRAMRVLLLLLLAVFSLFVGFANGAHLKQGKETQHALSGRGDERADEDASFAEIMAELDEAEAEADSSRAAAGTGADVAKNVGEGMAAAGAVFDAAMVIANPHESTKNKVLAGVGAAIGVTRTELKRYTPHRPWQL